MKDKQKRCVNSCRVAAKNIKAGNLWNNWHREASKFARRAVSQAPFTCSRSRLIPKSQLEHFSAEWFIGNCNYTIAHLFARLSLCLIGVFGQIILQYSSRSILSLGGWGQHTPKSTQGEVDPHSLVGVQTRDKTWTVFFPFSCFIQISDEDKNK